MPFFHILSICSNAEKMDICSFKQLLVSSLCKKTLKFWMFESDVMNLELWNLRLTTVESQYNVSKGIDSGASLPGFQPEFFHLLVV